MKYLKYIFTILILLILTVPAHSAETGANLVYGTIGIDYIQSGDTTIHNTFEANLGTGSNTFPACSNGAPLKFRLCSEGSTNRDRSYTLIIKLRNADTPNCSQCSFAAGAKFDLVPSVGTFAGFQASGKPSEFDTGRTLENTNSKTLSSIAEISMIKPFRAWQGVCTDGTYIYVTSDRDTNFSLSNTITKLDMYGNFISEKTAAYTGLDTGGRFMSFGSCYTDGTNLWAAVDNANGGGSPPYESHVIKS